MVEVEVAGLQHSHDLDSFRRFAVEWYAGRLEELLDKALEGDGVHHEVACVDESSHAVDERKAAIERFLKKRIFVFRDMGSYPFEDVHEIIG